MKHTWNLQAWNKLLVFEGFPQIALKNQLRKYLIPFPIHWFGAACCWGGAGAPNMSANGFPSCNKSSNAFDCCCAGCALPSAAPNKSTIFPDDAGGDDKNGFVAVGEPIFDWFDFMDRKKFVLMSGTIF